MKSTRVFLVVAIATAIVSRSALSQDNGRYTPSTVSRDSAELVELNRGYVDAFRFSRPDWYDAHLAPDYVFVSPDGIVTRAAFVNYARTPMTYKSFGLDSVEVKLVGNIALIRAINPYVRADGTTGVSRYTNVWVRRDGKWMTLQAQITPQKAH